MTRVLLVVGLALFAHASLGAQGTAGTPVSSPLTGLSLPAGTRLEKGFLNRAAAKATMELSAKDEGATLGARHEVYRLGEIDGGAATFDGVRALVEGQGWSFVRSAKGETWGWIDKERARAMLYVAQERDGTWLYLAEVSSRGAVAAAGATGGPRGTRPAAAPTGTRSTPVVTAPAPAPTTTTPIAETRPAESPPAAAPPAPRGGGARRFQFTTSNFDDGWVATEHSDFVLATRGALTAYLFYRVPMTEAMRPPASNVNDYFWNRDVRPRFDVHTEERRQQELMYSQLEYLEGDATERATGRRVYVGMLVSRNSAGALPIVVVAPDKQSFYDAYPQPADLERLLAYNKFAVAPADLVGHWSESTGSFAQMYYVNTGNYAGMNAATVSAEFWMQPDGSYRSQHKGASGMVGNMRVFQQEYRGTYRVNGNWEVTMTNRFEGRSDTFLMQFEVVKGGRILHLVNKAASGVQYHLGLQP